MPNLQKSQYAESLSPRRTQKARPDVYAKQPELRGSKLPHEMSYPTARTLQYGVTLAQESEPTVHSSNMQVIPAFFSLSRNPTDWIFASKAPRRSIDTDCLAPRILPRAALKRRHVSFQPAGHARRALLKGSVVLRSFVPSSWLSALGLQLLAFCSWP